MGEGGFKQLSRSGSTRRSRGGSTLSRALSASRRRLARDEGFSLIELLLVIVIVPIVIGSMALAIISALQQQTTVSNRLADSSDSQLTSALYVRDVQSATMVTTSGSATSPVPCGSGTTFLLGLNWNKPSGGQNVVSYWVTSGKLVRNSCTGGSPSVNAINIDGITSVAATICPTCASSGWTSGWVSTAGVSSISLAVTQSASNFRYNLLAVPRLWTPQSGGTPTGGGPIPPLLLLGSTGQVLGLNGNNNQLVVNGGIDLNSNSTGAVNLPGNNTILTTNNFLIYGCAPTAGSPCTNGAVNAPGNNNQIAQPTATTTLTADPLLSVPVPANPTGTGACTTSGSTITCAPGVYTTAPTFAANDLTINFQPGNYLFGGTSPVAFSGNGPTITFGSGIYIFHDGVSVTGQGSPSVTSGPGGVMFYIGNSGAPYDTGGDAAQLYFNSNNMSINLAAMTTGTYPGLLVFQNRADSALVVLDGNNPTVFSETGIIYAPAAQVLLNGNAGSVSAGSILAQSLILNGNTSTITLGP